MWLNAWVLALFGVAAWCGLTRGADKDVPPFRNDEKSEDGQWLMASKDFANTRYSCLDQIKPDNVGQLQVAWTFSTGINRGQEAAPLVVGSTMYVTTPYPNI